MYTSAILDLRDSRSWEPSLLTSEAFRWPLTMSEARLGELATRVAARSVTDVGSPVITPSNVDAATGSIRLRSRSYQGQIYQVGSELQLNDVLVPRADTGPALLISERLRGALISSGYLALRPIDEESAYWIWAVLTSESGRRLRIQLSQSGAQPVTEFRSLLEASIPVLPRDRLVAMVPDIAQLEAASHVSEEQATETWWHTVDLSTTEWRIALATNDLSRLHSGVPLSDLCSEITRGKNTRSGALDAEAPGYLPVTNVSVLAGKPTRRWVAPGDGRATVAYPGDLLMAGDGSLAYATIATAPVVVGHDVYVLRLRNPSLGPALAHYLNSQDGYSVRQMLAIGSISSWLRAADVARLPVPATALETSEHVSNTPPIPLSQRLEDMLWRS